MAGEPDRRRRTGRRPDPEIRAAVAFYTGAGRREIFVSGKL
jgi:hypothetical protein